MQRRNITTTYTIQTSHPNRPTEYHTNTG